MKHLQLFKEIESKVQEMCHEFLKYSGIHGVNAVNQIASALTTINNLKIISENEEESHA